MGVALPADFREFLRSLSSNGVAYLLIGGYAVSYHGYPRATNDLDVWVEVSRANADRLVAALKEFGFDLPELRPELFLRERGMVRMGRPPLRIEVATTISGVAFDECMDRAEGVILDGVPVRVISLDHLIQNKRAAGRPKDLADVEVLARRHRRTG
jgi:predicted nucleotidyltransferase